MLTITQLPNGKLSIKADYFYRTRIKSVPTATFNPDTKQWVVEGFMLGELERRFAGELVYKTPRWVILNEPIPDMSAMYKLSRDDIDVPQMKLLPYDYQNYGIKFMIDKIEKQGFVLNADDVGLGKTIQTIGTMQYFVNNNNVNKILIICKKSIKKQWIEEIVKFTDMDQDFVLIKTGSTAAQRKKAYAEFNKSTKAVLVTNYHSFLNDTAMFAQMNIDFVVIKQLH